MIVRYDVTVADMTAVMLREAKRRRPRLGWHWKQSAVVSALVAFFSAQAAVETAGPLAVSLWTVALFVIGFAALTTWKQLRVTMAIKRAVIERTGSQPFPFEIEIAREALVTRQLGKKMRWDWSQVTAVTEVIDGIYFDLRGGASIFVRGSAFQSSTEQSEFLRLSRQFAAEGSVLGIATVESTTNRIVDHIAKPRRDVHRLMRVVSIVTVVCALPFTAIASQMNPWEVLLLAGPFIIAGPIVLARAVRSIRCPQCRRILGVHVLTTSQRRRGIRSPPTEPRCPACGIDFNREMPVRKLRSS